MSDLLAGHDRRVRKSKAAMKNALLSLMQQKRFEDIFITDIVELADVNRGTFYKHYQQKEDLLDEALEDVIQDLVNCYRYPYQNKGGFKVSQLSSSAIKIFEHVHRQQAFYTSIIKSQAAFHFQQTVCNVLRELILQDLAELFPAHMNRELLAGYQSRAIFGMIEEWVRCSFKYSPEYMADELLKIIHAQHGGKWDGG